MDGAEGGAPVHEERAEMPAAEATADDAGDAAAGPAASGSPAEGKSHSLADDLFGEGSGDEEDRNVVRMGGVQRAPPGVSPSDSDMSDESSPRAHVDPDTAALEYLEEEGSAPAPLVEEQTAWVNLPQMPMRRTKRTHIARLPNFVRHVTTAFDPESWDPHEEDDVLRAAGAAYTDLDDDETQCLVRTANTMRWRWRGEGPSRTPESNARIVRWSDGSRTLQLGGDMLEMNEHREAMASGRVDAPLTYVYVPYRKEGLLQAEMPVTSSLSFKPNLRSESYRKLANALRHQRSARVVARSELFSGLDPERAKEKIERQFKEAEKKKHREWLKAYKSSADYDGDLDLDSRRMGARGRTRGTRDSRAPEYSDDEEMAGGEYDQDDGFVVEDEDEAGSGAEDAEQEEADEDEIDAADRRIEQRERDARGERDGQEEDAEGEPAEADGENP